jgi:hypothetical protein
MKRKTLKFLCDDARFDFKATAICGQTGGRRTSPLIDVPW